MTREEDKEIVLDQEVSEAEAVRAKGAMLRKKLELALKSRGTIKAKSPITSGSDLFSSNVGDEDSEGITPDEMQTPFPEFVSSRSTRMNSTMFGLPSLEDSSVSEADLAQPSHVDTRSVSAADLPSELLRFGVSDVSEDASDASDELDLEPLDADDSDSEFDLEQALAMPTFNAEAVNLPSQPRLDRDPIVVSSGDHPASLMLAESESEWSVGDIDLNGELPGEEPEPPAFKVEPAASSLGPAPADADMGGPGVYIHRKSGSSRLRGGSGLHKLSQGDIDELFTSSVPGLPRQNVRSAHQTPRALRMNPVQMAASVAGVSDVSVGEDLECSLMFSRGGEPVTSVAVDEGFVSALIAFALDYAARVR